MRWPLCALVACCVTACSSSPASGERAPHDAGSDASADAAEAGTDGGDAAADGDASSSDADGDAPDFSSLVPTPCLPTGAEDLRGFDRSAIVPESSPPLLAQTAAVLALLEDPAIAASLEGGAIGALRDQRAAALVAAVDSCNGDPACLAPAFKFSPSDVSTLRLELEQLLVVDTAVAGVAARLRSTGLQADRAEYGDGALLDGAVGDALQAYNAAYDQYTQGHDPATLDALAYDATVGVTTAPVTAPLSTLVVSLLTEAGRDEAVRYEPLATGDNLLPIAELSHVDFGAFPFSSIVVPGKGPSVDGQALDPLGVTRCEQAAARFRAGLAPFIITSGGHVHPDRTPYSEAIEMRRYLVDVLGIPAARILVDPYARHTTTNLRNVARQIYRYGLPTDQPALVTTDIGQTVYMSLASDTGVYGKRCNDELGYQPYRSLVQLGPNDLCWLPRVTSLHQAPSDLLDP